MTKKELSQIYYLKKELKMWQDERQRIEDKLGAGKWLDGMPRGASISDSTGNLAAELATCGLMVKCKEMEIQVQLNKTIKYISEIEDSLMRQIIYYRCISLMSWGQVAKTIGGNHTANSVRMSFNRYLGGGDVEQKRTPKANNQIR